MKIESQVVHGCENYDEKTGAVSFPIYQSATFRHPALYETTGYDYSRLQNPTREKLEDTIAVLEQGKKGFAFSSGMAAVTTVMKLFSPGDHLIFSEDLYGGTYRLMEEIYAIYGIEVSYIDTSKINDLKNVTRDNTKAIFIETPTNPMMVVTDIQEVTSLAKSLNLLTIVDNTFLSPYFQKPLLLGADIVIHSGTKYLGGHNDTLAGFIVTNNQTIIDKLLLLQKSEGAILAPFDCWLMLRGIKTLAVRMEKHQENALVIANWLKTHPMVEKVFYVGLPKHPSYHISKKQSTGFGGMISFEVKNLETIERILRKVKLIMFAESLGGVETLLTYPMVQTHSAIPEEIRNRIGVNEKLLRLSVGIEHVDDLIADLSQAFEED